MRVRTAVYRLLRPIARRFGADIIRADNVVPFARHIKRIGFTVAFDVGANAGQFAGELRSTGYRGKIVSFEPVEEPFLSLASNAKKDPNWIAIRAGLGRCAGEQQIRVNIDSPASSFRPSSDRLNEASPRLKTARMETVRLAVLDDIFSDYASPQDIVLLKLDVQGFEDEVLAGAEKCLPKIRAVQIEMATTECYAGERLMTDQVNFLHCRGFRLIDLSAAFRDDKDRLLQVDGFFERDD